MIYILPTARKWSSDDVIVWCKHAYGNNYGTNPLKNQIKKQYMQRKVLQ